MSRPRQLSQWTERLTSRLPNLSLPQVRGLAGWSFAIAITPTVARLIRIATVRARTRAGNSSLAMITASEISAVRKSRASVWHAVNCPLSVTKAVRPLPKHWT